MQACILFFENVITSLPSRPPNLPPSLPLFALVRVDKAK